ncbi:MAG: tRNA (adenosine(37)-N6)-threonylcarbamoyltransferase complex ATPase subunit type 1 TsaE [Thermodesulfobacteriota bacterium]
MTDTENLELQLNSSNETLKLGEIIGKSLNPGSIIALVGDLGAGKTVLVKGIAKGLGVQEEPNSPTFVIMNSYEGRIPLYHFDLYRLSDEEELLGIGYDEYFFGNGVAAVEWADRVQEIFPDHTLRIEISIPESTSEDSMTTRKIKLQVNKQWVLLFKNTAEQAFPTLKK